MKNESTCPNLWDISKSAVIRKLAVMLPHKKVEIVQIGDLMVQIGNSEEQEQTKLKISRRREERWKHK